MIRRGDDAVSFLEHADWHDEGRSSHWELMQSKLERRGDDVRAVGFGAAEAPRGPISGAVHWWMQRPLRSIGARLEHFAACERVTKSVVKAAGRAYNMDAMRQALTAALVLEHVSLRGSLVAVIGDGFGVLSALLRGLGARVLNVNLTASLFVDAVSLRRAGQPFVLVEAADEAMAGDAIVLVRADDHELLAELPITVAISVAAFQEMNPDVVAGYFSTLRASPGDTWLYVCSRVEKTLPDGTVVRLADYPWSDEDLVIVDEPCPWSQRVYSTRPPRWVSLDGPVQHRLVRLAR